MPRSEKVDSQMFSLQSAEHVNNCKFTLKHRPVVWYVYLTLFSLKVLTVFHHLVHGDIHTIWEVSPIFLKQKELHVIIADPVEVGIHGHIMQQ